MGVEEGAWCKKILTFKIFFNIQVKNTSNLTLLSCKVPSERFFHQVFKTGLYFLKYVVLRIAKLSPKLSTYR